MVMTGGWFIIVLLTIWVQLPSRENHRSRSRSRRRRDRDRGRGNKREDGTYEARRDK